MTTRNSSLKVENLDHLGLVAGIIDELEIVEAINQLVGVEAGEIVTAGQIVKAIIINGLGFISQPLYLFPQFFQGKATEHLLGEGVLPEYLNDDKIGRVMDKLFLKGLTDVFLLIALKTIKKYGIDTKYLHLDSTSFSLEGDYENKDSSFKVVINKKSSDSEQKNLDDQEQYLRPEPIKITPGYSRDHRPDLKQFILDLIVSGDGDVPLFLRAADGNESDKAVFGKILAQFSLQIDWDSIWVADSALYSQGNLLLIKDLKWITRVPLSIKAAQHLVTTIESKELVISQITGYAFVEKTSNYGGVEQRWLIIESEKRKQSDLQKLEKKIKQEELKAQKQLSQFSRQKFESAAGAKEILKSLNNQLKYHQFQLINIRLTENNSYEIQAKCEQNTQIISRKKKQAGRFILATNIVDNQQLSAEEMLRAYKEQQAVERGFSFLKDPLFFADSVFIKTPERIETMAMLMGLCLLVYTIAQRQLRRQLIQCNTGLKNQLGKLTLRPTLRWIFQCFQGIHVVFLKGVKQIVNLTDDRWWTLSFFPESVQKYYLLSG
ncbi:MAG: IS1634 family transposase [Merismopedia sp. SIO2A8]|nr:IS1634 family transposase [Merismopedia sp. SIO2A8]